ncbi:MAG: transcriptional repressor [Candidatus Pacebacteria bacterium]|nr:transcriptional repressor [Candidatus Paceibacterota bacterium]
MNHSSDIRDRLRSAGLRATTPRLSILKTLNNATRPLSVDEIFRSLSRTGLDRVTVYRTLEHFKRGGIVRDVDLKKISRSYELRDENDHHHIVCISCGKTEDFTGCDIETLASRALKNSRSFTSVTEHSLELFGTCTTCVR